MCALLFPDDFNLPAFERLLIGSGVAFLHFLLAVFVLRTTGQEVLGTGNRSQGAGAVLSVTFVTVMPSMPSTQMPAVPALLPAPEAENGPDARTADSHAASSETVAVLSETGQYASTIVASKAPPYASRQAAAASSTSAAKGGSPGDDRLASYHAALRAAIRMKWAALTDRSFPSDCALRLNLAPGGSVNATSANSCVLSNEDRLQLEAAALMAQPLPYAGYEAVFASDLQLQL